MRGDRTVGMVGEGGGSGGWVARDRERHTGGQKTIHGIYVEGD
jgi:hypothetical protein